MLKNKNNTEKGKMYKQKALPQLRMHFSSSEENHLKMNTVKLNDDEKERGKLRLFFG